MKLFEKAVKVFIVSLIVVPCLACSQQKISIASVSSAKDALRELVNEYRMDNPKAEVRINFGATGDIFDAVNTGRDDTNIIVLVNSDWFNTLASTKKLKDGTISPFGKNSLVLVGSKYAAANKIDKPADLVQLLANEQLAIGNPATVVFGRSIIEIFKYYNIYEELKGKFDLFNDAKSTLQAVEIAQTNYGIIYKTDAIISSDVKTIYTFPQESYNQIAYSIAGVTETYNSSCDKFLKFVHSETGKQIIEQYGFDIN
ncbi:MAG: molybdate ABC transporter substrate-binding protein [Spirochaetia bacterium]|jgi:molybdate transport system substrate-binding protein|nr:molybdate ABC transporter substrate-binding protein [Spirochaetia bacterium]